MPDPSVPEPSAPERDALGLRPLTAAEWGDEEYAAYGSLLRMPADQVPRFGSGHAYDPERFSVVGTFVRHPRLAAAFWRFNGYQLQRNSLPLRWRELAILRVAHRRNSAYEWGQHVKIALEGGITAEEIDELASGNLGFDGTDRLVLEATDELLGDGRISDELLPRIAADLDTHQMMDLVFIVGTYCMLAMAFETWRLTPEPGTALPAPVSARFPDGMTVDPIIDQTRSRRERFLDSARAIIAEKGSIEFTVQEVVDRSKQSLRSFYQYFDGKNALLLALFDEEMGLFVERMREGTAAGEPLDRLRDTVLMLYDLCAPGRLSVQPLFADFAQRLIVDQPDDVSAAYAPVIEYIASIVHDAAAADLLRPGRPHRLATIVLQTATITAGRTSGGQPISGDEVWEFCLHAIVPDDVLEFR